MGLLVLVGVVGVHLNCAGRVGDAGALGVRVSAVSGGVLPMPSFLSDKIPLVCQELREVYTSGIDEALPVQGSAAAPARVLWSDEGSICVQDGDVVTLGQRVAMISGGELVIPGFLSDKKPLVCEELCEWCAPGVGDAVLVSCSAADPVCVGSFCVQGGDVVALDQRVTMISGGELLIPRFLSDKKPLVCEELCEWCAPGVGDAVLVSCSAADPICGLGVLADVTEMLLATVVEDGSTCLGEAAVAATTLSTPSRECGSGPTGTGLLFPTAGAVEFNSSLEPTSVRSVRARNVCGQLSSPDFLWRQAWRVAVACGRLHDRVPETSGHHVVGMESAPG